jgi:REP element-mobilizing transposase RayT
MPRAARIDYPGLLQHVIIRGIERGKIFLDDQDRQLFLDRFSHLLEQTGTDCLAWTLLDNHAHFLLRTGTSTLARFMRRLLTGHATSFNLRHRRSGHLFQNRYKSIVCEEEPYLLELVRYIHLNPLRAGLVPDMDALGNYCWSGHSALLGERSLRGQVTEEILRRFANRLPKARQLYRQFVADGVAMGQRNELRGGGLRRSSQLAGAGEEVGEGVFDQRVLGGEDFVKQVLQRSEQAPAVAKLPLAELLQRVAHLFDLPAELLRQRKRSRAVTEARSVLCYFAVREMGMSGERVGRMLNISRAAVSFSAGRGEVLVAENPILREKIGTPNTQVEKGRSCVGDLTT